MVLLTLENKRSHKTHTNHTRTHTHARTRTRTHTYKDTHSHTSTYKHMHTHIQGHTHKHTMHFASLHSKTHSAYCWVYRFDIYQTVVMHLCLVAECAFVCGVVWCMLACLVLLANVHIMLSIAFPLLLTHILYILR